MGPEDAAAVFAAPPPIEALRFLLSRAMTELKEDRGADRTIAFLDISRAHLHSPVRREIYVRACKEDLNCPVGSCWKLLKAMYGLRDAGAAFDSKAESTMRELGFDIGVFSPCLCFCQATGVGVHWAASGGGRVQPWFGHEGSRDTWTETRHGRRQ